MLIRPFSGSVVSPEHAAESVTPALEVLDAAERSEFADRRPRSYLHVIAGEAEDTDPSRRAARLERCEAALQRLLSDGVFVPTGGPRAVAYRVDAGPRTHTGLLVEVAIVEQLSERVRPHEQIRTEKVDRFTDHLRTVGASSTPALLLHRPTAELATVRDELAGGSPDVDVTAVDGTRHRLWVREEPDLVRRLSDRVSAIETLYIGDGHHRIAAAARLAETLDDADGPPDDDPRRRFLACLMPTDEVGLLAYHRVVSAVDGPGRDEILSAVARRVPTERVDDPGRQALRPQRSGTAMMRLADGWIRLDLAAVRDDGGEVLFDAEVLQEEVLAPVFGIADPTIDRRLSFVADDRIDELVERCRHGDAIGFVLAPAAVADVLTVADGGRTVPPKSTWFQPKLPSGLVLHHLRPGTTGGDHRDRHDARTRS